MFYAVADRVQALRVPPLLPMPPSLPNTTKRERVITGIRAPELILTGRQLRFTVYNGG